MNSQQIEKLLEKHAEKLPMYVDKWKKIGLDTSRIKEDDKPVIKELVDQIYKENGLTCNEIVYCQSPYECVELAKAREIKIDLNNFCFANHDVWWGVYDLLETEAKDEYEDEHKLGKPFMELSKRVSWFYPTDDMIFICEKPNKLFINDKEVLHKDGDAAISYTDGHEHYFLNNVEVSKEIVMTPAENFPVDLFFKEKNAEKRREIIRKVGIDVLFSSMKSKLLEKKSIKQKKIMDNVAEVLDYELYSVQILEVEDVWAKMLKMNNPSIGVFHCEFVSNECETVDQALEFRNGVKGIPEILT